MEQHLVAESALPFLLLVTLADAITKSTFTALAGPSLSEPGVWNLGAAAIILSGVSDILGQLVLGYVADSRSSEFAMFMNASVFFPNKRPILAGVVAPPLKCFGGGSHASAFLTLAVLHRQPAVHLRSASYYVTGSIVVFAEACGPVLVSALSKHGHFVPGVVSGVCCLVAYSVTALPNLAVSVFEALNEQPGASVTDPLLPPQEAPHQETHRQVHPGPLGSYRDALSSLNRNLSSMALAFFLMAISKATRPLFTSYIQHRDGVTAKQAKTLWVIRGIMSVAIFGLLLLLAVVFLLRNISSFNNITLHLGTASIILMGSDALMIGLSTSFSAITTALVINTLGVATDLSVLAFSANLFSNDVAGRLLMLIATTESAGTLLGIGILYPIYQWSLDESTSSLSGGLPYYICASIYAVVAGIVWSLKPLTREA